MAAAAAQPANAAAGPRDNRTKEENKIPWLWAELQGAATAGKSAKFAKLWCKVQENVHVAVEVLQLGDAEEKARAAAWTADLQRMTTAYNAGAVAINACLCGNLKSVFFCHDTFFAKRLSHSCKYHEPTFSPLLSIWPLSQYLRFSVYIRSTVNGSGHTVYVTYHGT